MMFVMKAATDYWFTIEPYVYINVINNYALLYNTLDRVTIESENVEVIELLQEILHKENCGVVLLTDERYKQKNIAAFIKELRYNYMGDIIDVSLSKGKPVQLLPFFNFSDNHDLYERQNFHSRKNILENLSEINIYVDRTTDMTKLISFLQSIPMSLTFNIIEDVTKSDELLFFLDQLPSPKNILCSYANVRPLQPTFENNFSYRISVHFPIDSQQWERAMQIILKQTLAFEFIFEVSSEEDCLQAELLIDRFRIEKYQMKPVYTGENINFFEENVFLTKGEILSTSMSIKDFYTNQSMNIYDFGKINIMPNGDAYANLNHPALGNIYTDCISEIVHKEVEAGKSWFRIRNETPCNNCIYQWLCPPPSDYEITIGRPNLCHVR